LGNKGKAINISSEKIADYDVIESMGGTMKRVIIGTDSWGRPLCGEDAWRRRRKQQS